MPPTTWPTTFLTWPFSTKLANEGSADSSNLANTSSEDNRPVSTVSADSSQVSADSQTSAVSPAPIQPEEPESLLPTKSSPLPSSPSSVPEPPPNLPHQTNLANPPSEPVTSVPEEKPSESPVSNTDTNIISANQQAPQVQQEAPNDASNIDTGKTPDQLANFKPEPPEQPQEAPMANTDSDYSSQKSFGDLLSSENQPPSSPSIPSIPPSPPVPSTPSSPAISFGDLIKDIEITPPVIPEAERPVEQQQPTPHSQPPPQTSVSISSLPQSPLPSEASAKEGQSPQDKLVLLRQKANQVRSQKKQAHLDKIMELVKNTRSISNTDIQRLLHISQSTATNYLSELSGKRLLKKQGIRGGAKYFL